MAIVIYRDKITGRKSLTDEASFLSAFRERYGRTDGETWDREGERFLEAQGIDYFLNGDISLEESGGGLELVYRYLDCSAWMWEAVEAGRKTLDQERLYLLLDRMEEWEQTDFKYLFRFLKQEWCPWAKKTKKRMHLILLEQDGMVKVTDELELLKEFVGQVSNGPLPEDSFTKGYFHGKALNGELTYSKENGGFTFIYDPERANIFEALEREADQILSDGNQAARGDFCHLLRTFHNAGLLTAFEHNILLQAFAKEKRKHLILLEEPDGSIRVTDEGELTRELADKWDGCGVPSDAFYRKTFRGKALNGILHYSQDCAGFIFWVHEKRRLVFEVIEKAISQTCYEDMDNSDILLGQLQALYHVGLINEDEFHALDRTYCSRVNSKIRRASAKFGKTKWEKVPRKH